MKPTANPAIAAWCVFAQFFALEAACLMLFHRDRPVGSDRPGDRVASRVGVPVPLQRVVQLEHRVNGDEPADRRVVGASTES